jgi:hypothetical protein
MYQPAPYKPGAGLTKIGIIIGMFGVILAGVGVMLFIAMFEAVDHAALYKVIYALIGIGVIFAGLGNGMYRLGKEAQSQN